MIYLNGNFVTSDGFAIKDTDRGLLLADGLFETMRVYNKHVFRLKDHYDRMVAGAKILKINIRINVDELNKIILDLLKQNKLINQDSTLRLTITRGVGQRGLLPPTNQNPTIMLTASPYHASKFAPIRLYVSNITRRNEKSPLSNIKSLCYLDNILAKSDAIENMADDAVILNTQDKVACVSAGNLFIVKNDDVIITPKIEDGILPGVTRKSIIEICKENKLTLLEKSITVDELLAAKEIFITNSIIEVQPVNKINNNFINDGDFGKITMKIRDLYLVKIKKSIMANNSSAFV